MPSDGEIAISVRDLTKSYRIFGHPADRLKQAVSFGFRRFYRRFTALEGVSFEIKRGETVGIIGRNGSGKSTLLQLVCGILKPSGGTVRVTGRVSALLELGAGFNAEFTGRENVYFHGTLMGFTKAQMDQRFEDIADFADIGEYIDQPVRTYSSGMFVRLAFAVAVHVEPDILVVDEALSVGDVVFQHKSKKKVQNLIDAGANLLLVSHDRNLIVSTCDRCILMHKGRMITDGPSSEVFDYYHAMEAAKSDGQISYNRLDSGRAQVVSGSGEARVVDIRLLGSNSNQLGVLDVGMPAVFEFLVRVSKGIPKLVFGFVIRDRLGQSIFSTNTNNFGKSPVDVRADAEFVFTFSLRVNIGAGSYSVSTFVASSSDRFESNYESRELAFFFEVQNMSHPLFVGSAWLDPELTVRGQ